MSRGGGVRGRGVHGRKMDLKVVVCLENRREEVLVVALFNEEPLHLVAPPAGRRASAPRP